MPTRRLSHLQKQILSWRPPPAHGSRVGRRHREQRRGGGVSSGLAGRNWSHSLLSGMRVLTVHITTEIIFALFDLLGYRFTPRLRDLSDRRLFTSGTIDMPRYPRLQPQVTHRINRLRILEWWDDMVRVIGSMKLGWVTASLFVQKLQAYPQQNALAMALQEYGRLVRTLHIMRWYASPEERRRILRQLNKGEALHDLRAALVIANKGHLRHPRGEHLAHQASCLNLVTNAVIVWNTVYMAAVVEQLKQEGYPVQDSDLTHIWPTRYAHINVYGKYHFNVDEARRRQGLRPLRLPGRRAS